MTITSMNPVTQSMPDSNSPIGIAVIAKSLDVFEQSGADIIRMMEQSVNPNVGRNFDVTI